uniref:Uncharacterized protein n=1 Tax=Knipowitschia caucasica TaxID=637954 RepID=A0AAV2MGK7_KNICA
MTILGEINYIRFITDIWRHFLKRNSETNPGLLWRTTAGTGPGLCRDDERSFYASYAQEPGAVSKAHSGHRTTGHKGDTESDSTRTFEDSNGSGQMSYGVVNGCAMEEKDTMETPLVSVLWYRCCCEYNGIPI